MVRKKSIHPSDADADADAADPIASDAPIGSLLHRRPALSAFYKPALVSQPSKLKVLRPVEADTVRQHASAHAQAVFEEEVQRFGFVLKDAPPHAEAATRLLVPPHAEVATRLLVRKTSETPAPSPNSSSASASRAVLDPRTSSMHVHLEDDEASPRPSPAAQTDASTSASVASKAWLHSPAVVASSQHLAALAHKLARNWQVSSPRRGHNRHHREKRPQSFDT
jgi:hypothetical protein